MLMPDEKPDVEQSHALHEMSHGLMFAQSEFYSTYAARVLKTGSAEVSDEIFSLVEAVPSVLSNFGQRYSKGTDADNAVTEGLVELSEIFTTVHDEAHADSSMPDPTGLSTDDLFTKTVAITFAQAWALEAERAFQDKAPFDAADRIAAMSQRLREKRHNDAPREFEDVRAHIVRLVNGDREIVSMFQPQIEVASILSTAPISRLVENMVLVAAVARIEFFSLAFGETVVAGVFGSHTNYFPMHIAQWAKRVVGVPHRVGAKDAVKELTRDFWPLKFQGCDVLVMPDDGHEDDPEYAACAFKIAVATLFSRLPSFIEWFVDEPFSSDIVRRKARELHEGHADALAHYLTALEERRAKFLRRKFNADFAAIPGSVQLYPIDHPKRGKVFVMSKQPDFKQ